MDKRKLATILSSLVARLIIFKYKPIVVAITGNVGKSSTKEAVEIILSNKYTTRKNELNYNTEIGVALTIMGINAEGSGSTKVWLSYLFKGIKQIIFKNKNYPQVLILEYGADRKNDISKLCKIARPDIAIVTSIGQIPVHVEFFDDVDSVYEEKSSIIKMLKEKGTAILNFDNEKIFDFKKFTKAKIISYGFNSNADVHISSYKIEPANDLLDSTMYIRFEYKNHFAPFEIKKFLGKGFAYSFLCGIAAGLALDMNLVDCLNALEQYKGLPGRLNLIQGIKNSYIINDCYNASLIAVENAIELMNDLTDGKKVFVFGDMKELGTFSEKAHRLVAKAIIDNKIDRVVLVGNQVCFTQESLIKQGFDKNKIFEFKESQDARLKIQDIIYPGDLILIKGSHSMNMNIISKEIAFDPLSIDKI